MGCDSEFVERSLAFKSDRDIRTAVTQALQIQESSWDHHLQHLKQQQQQLRPSSDSQRWDSIRVASFMKNNAELMNTTNNSSNSSSSSSSSSVFVNSALDSSSKTQLEALQKSLGIVDTFLDSSGGGANSNNNNNNNNNNNAQLSLSAPSSIGAGTTKVSKKRSRASRRPPTTVLEADSANFRSMVQHLTGIPPPMMSSSLHHSNRFDFLGSAASGLVRPQPTRALSYVSPGPGALLRHQHTEPVLLQHHQQQQQQQVYGSNFRSYPGYGMRSFEPQLLQHAAANVTKPLQLSFNSSNSNQEIYVAAAASQSGPSSGLSMPSLWECEARGGPENLNTNVKREADAAAGAAAAATASGGGGRPAASSWSTSL